MDAAAQPGRGQHQLCGWYPWPLACENEMRAGQQQRNCDSRKLPHSRMIALRMIARIPLCRFARSMRRGREKVHPGRGGARRASVQSAAAVPSGPRPPLAASSATMTGQQGSRARWLVLAALLLAIAVQRVQRTARHSPSFVQVADRAYRWEPAGRSQARLRQAAEWPGDAMEGAVCCAEGLFPLQGRRRRRCSRLPPATHHSHGRSCPPQTHTALVPAAGPHHSDTCICGPVPWRQGLGECQLGHGGRVLRSGTVWCTSAWWVASTLPAHSPPCSCFASGGCGRRHQEQPAPVTRHQPGEGCAGGHPCWRARCRHCMCAAAAAGWWQRLALQLPYLSAVVQHC